MICSDGRYWLKGQYCDKISLNDLSKINVNAAMIAESYPGSDEQIKNEQRRMMNLNTKKKLLIQKNLITLSWFSINLILIICLFISVIVGLDASLEPTPDRLIKTILIGFILPSMLLLLLNPIIFNIYQRTKNKLDWVLIDEKKKIP